MEQRTYIVHVEVRNCHDLLFILFCFVIFNVLLHARIMVDVTSCIAFIYGSKGCLEEDAHVSMSSTVSV